MLQTAINKHILPLREVGERSWSVLQTEASQRGKRRDLLRVLSGGCLVIIILCVPYDY